jgi:hypothetical protein
MQVSHTVDMSIRLDILTLRPAVNTWLRAIPVASVLAGAACAFAGETTSAGSTFVDPTFAKWAAASEISGGPVR